ncbi:PLP-dependent aminotransferase family protein [Salinarimonas soli]|uniref:PLP-dependent aminotransferase family protein n=1 Tax=Salinarimonas soli TaxID=1638099 RepID=A0A5B2VHD8_9HYPH|nr:PLP-dependent aminotransferase family protein [Salinarimonas soli]KAA2237749.1 PLP-dependent aminotransferase family protein [Salinarimonas soli]
MLLHRPDIDALARERRLPLFKAVAEAIAGAIADGRLKPGDRLPTHRALAFDLGLTISTVTEAYREATRRRLVSGEVGRGTFVLAESREAELFALGRLDPSERIDLSTNVPADLAGEAIEAHLRMLPADVLRRAGLYPGAGDLARARLAIARFMERRSLRLRSAEIVACAGAQQALTVALLGLAGRGGDVLCEALAAPGVKAAARSLGLRLHPVPLDGEGVEPEGLLRAARATSARVVVLVPALQNPTGAVMGANRRRALAEVIRAAGLALVEDDVYGPLVDEGTVAAGCWERAVIASSLSKSVAPGLRFGWLTGGHPILPELARDIHLTAWGVSPLVSALAVSLIESGEADSLVRRQREEVATRHRLAFSTLGRGRRIGAPGPHLWWPVSGEADGAAAAASALGVEVVPGGVFAVGRGGTDHVRLCLAGTPSRARLKEGLERLAGLEAFGRRDG